MHCTATRRLLASVSYRCTARVWRRRIATQLTNAAHGRYIQKEEEKGGEPRGRQRLFTRVHTERFCVPHAISA